MIAIGMDLSTTASALVALESGTVKPIAATTVKRSRMVAGSPNESAYLCEMAERVRDWTKGFDDFVVAIEDVYVQRGRRQGDDRPPQNPGVVLNLARLNGMVEYLMWHRGILVVRFEVTAWCRLALGKSTAKAARSLAVWKRYGVELGDEHQVDAYGIAMAALMRIQQGGNGDGRRAAPAAAGRRRASAVQPELDL